MRTVEACPYRTAAAAEGEQDRARCELVSRLIGPAARESLPRRPRSLRGVHRFVRSHARGHQLRHCLAGGPDHG